jgi:hypothetical protein
MFKSKEEKLNRLDMYKITYSYTGLKDYVKFVFSEDELKKWCDTHQAHGVQIIKIEKYEPVTVNQ